MTENRNALKRFFAGVGRILSVTRAVISALFSLVFILFFLVVLGSLFDRQQFDMPEQGALRVEINGYLVDQRGYPDPLAQLINPSAPREYVVGDLIQAIDLAAEDERINSMVLVLHNMLGGGTSKIEELGQALVRFREAGKPILAISDFYNQQQYLLASYASEIIMHPMGLVDIRGFAAYQTYLGEALENLSVNLHVFRTGEFKDAVEPFTSTAMSEESRQQNQMLLDDIWQSYSQGILQRRAIGAADFTRYVEAFDQALLEQNGDAAQMALEFGLVDRVLDRDQSLDYSIKLVGPNEDEDFYAHIDVLPYLRMESLGRRDSADESIGLVVASGPIYDGVQAPGAIGGESLAGLLRRTRQEADHAALLVRIDSPGGSAFASELIRRELDLFRQQGIPVVVSMGSVAASGGYWIATAADHIVATPTTITGSIGVFSIFPTLEDSLARLGLYSDGVETAPLADAMQLDRPLDERASRVIQARVDHIYARFIELVAESRSIPEDQLDPIAGGRVWSGRQALELELVDELGSLEAAERAAAQLAGLEDYRVELVEPPLSFAERVARAIGDSVETLVRRLGTNSAWQSLLTLLAEPVEQTLALTDPQALFLYCSLCSVTGEL